MLKVIFSGASNLRGHRLWQKKSRFSCFATFRLASCISRLQVVIGATTAAPMRRTRDLVFPETPVGRSKAGPRALRSDHVRVLAAENGHNPLERLDSWKDEPFGFRCAGFGFRCGWLGFYCG